MNNQELQRLTVELVQVKAAFDEAERLAKIEAQKLEQITEKISKSNQYSKEPNAFVNCGDLGLYHLKFHKETGALVATHLVKNAVLEPPKYISTFVDDI
jgi:hypothetical protein